MKTTLIGANVGLGLMALQLGLPLAVFVAFGGHVTAGSWGCVAFLVVLAALVCAVGAKDLEAWWSWRR